MLLNFRTTSPYLGLPTYGVQNKTILLFKLERTIYPYTILRSIEWFLRLRCTNMVKIMTIFNFILIRSRIKPGLWKFFYPHLSTLKSLYSQYSTTVSMMGVGGKIIGKTAVSCYITKVAVNYFDCDMIAAVKCRHNFILKVGTIINISYKLLWGFITNYGNNHKL